MLANRVRMGSSDKEYKLRAGNIVAYENTNEVSRTGISFGERREVKVNRSGTIRVVFNLKSNSDTRTAYGIVYINDISIGEERSTNSTSYVDFSEDFAVEEGDLIQLYMKTSSPGGTAYNNLFQIKVKSIPPAGTFEQIL